MPSRTISSNEKDNCELYRVFHSQFIGEKTIERFDILWFILILFPSKFVPRNLPMLADLNDICYFVFCIVRFKMFTACANDIKLEKHLFPRVGYMEPIMRSNDAC